MALADEVSKVPGRLTRVLTTDFCPWANRFVYWLKEPVGWFVLATAVSVIVGLYVAPIGWTLAASLSSIIVVGMVWPWVAVHVVSCSLEPVTDQVHEDDHCGLQLLVRNRVPVPIWGLAVEGFLDRKCDEDEESATIPTVALAFVRGMSICTYRFSIQPQLRGRYPDNGATLTCAFPFGIWTAKRKMVDIAPVTVWPKVFPIAGQSSMAGSTRAERGEGNRIGRCGDFIGVREHRRGDCLKQVNWAATARSDSLIVTERSGPECPSLRFVVDTSAGCTRDEIADRIRVAASLLSNLHQSAIPLRVRVGVREFIPRIGREGLVQMFNALTDVPVDGEVDAIVAEPPRGTASVTVSSDEDGDPVVRVSDPTVNHRISTESQQRVLSRADDLAAQLSTFWTEVRDANLVA